jgi:hypothetical protein
MAGRNWTTRGIAPFLGSRITFTSDSRQFQNNDARKADVNQMLYRLRANIARPAVQRGLNAANSGTTLERAVYTAAQALNQSEALLSAYVNLAMPYELELSEVLQSAFKGDPARSELGLRNATLPGLVTRFQADDASNQSDAGNRGYDVGSIASILNARVDAINAEIQRAISTRPTEASGYVEWLITEATTLRDHRSRLAIDDTFGLEVPPIDRNVLANDVRQASTPGRFRPLQIDPTFGPGQPGFLAPSDGTVIFNSDGTFVFTPSNSNFAGTQTFSYRARCNIGMSGSDVVWAYSSPAYVRIHVAPASGCDSIDFNNNTVFPEDQDVIDFFTVLAGGECSPGNTCNDIDFNNNNVFPEDQDVIDFFNVLAGGTCP